MLFNSSAFLFFFAVVVLAYFSMPHKWRWVWLLAASVFFYAWAAARYLPLIGSIIVIDYVAGIAIERQQGRRRLLCLWASLAANLGALGYYKYWNFLGESLQQLVGHFGPHLDFHPIQGFIPVGLSFHTFQALSYTIEVYRGNQRAERHFGIYALYVMFFPQMVAGPIERPQNLLHQFREVHQFNSNAARSGLQLVAWGLFKKMVVADTLAGMVNPVYDHPSRATGLTFAIATVCFAYQIYCDFSGYSDVAIGAAQVLGFKLMTNFRRPYHAASLGEFWSRWHISLSTWFRDYVYIPLGGSHVPKSKLCRNLLITFILSGIWHGANWTFVAWGLFHGVARLLERAMERGGAPIGGWKRAIGIVRTFAIVSVGWVFFRAASLSVAAALFSKTFTGWDALFSPALLFDDLSRAGLWIGAVGWAMVLIASVEIVQWAQSRWPLRETINCSAWWARWSVYYAVVFIILLFGQFSEPVFIYYRF